VEVFCYSNHRGVDELTLRLRPSVDHWRTVVGVTDAVLADVIRRDGIDILVDLSGHTAGHRLETFARKPAPVQVSWVGYFDTTGLDTIDYILLDRFVCPAEAEGGYSERVLRLPDGYLCYAPQSDQPVAPLPASTCGYVTFGCFNKVAKVTPQVVELWSRILHTVPEARLCLKDTAFDDAAVRERYTRLFASHGIGHDRLTLLGRTPYQEYLETFAQIDIALDPFPFNGGTTTIESLWMGVPVVALAGDRFVGRMGVSHLSNLGLSELIADSPAAYVDTAVQLACDLPRLTALRSGLRERMTASPLTDGQRFTQALEGLYRQMWRTWCATQSPRE
jgi:predicted O-linked N-acetylglucosamine transferase (SPINDLY family)